MSIPKFKNESYTDWSKPANRKKQEEAIAKLESQFGQEYPNIIGVRRFIQVINLTRSIHPIQVKLLVCFRKGQHVMLIMQWKLR